MNEKPEKSEAETTGAETTEAGSTGNDREERPPASAKDKPRQKKKPGDAARKMREMFKG
ncbi:hypothetical protein [Actinomadura soli]|uniref:hypothetical protein n=1 Tax=Actinomadura soli TaxID=2508997 RepID=UPI0014875654|nr:hypothetical protein [Actinomadura soli]